MKVFSPIASSKLVKKRSIAIKAFWHFSVQFFKVITLYNEVEIISTEKIWFEKLTGMFLHPTKEAETGVVTITDNSIGAVRSLLEFMYSGEVQNLKEKAEELFVIAEKYHVSNLKIICEETLSSSLALDNVCRLLILADLYSAEKLKNNCFDFICENRKCIVKSNAWQDLKLSAPNLATAALEWTI